MLNSLLILAGLGQIGLVIGSLAIPKILNWKKELSAVSPLIKNIFWTYAGYILVTNLCFGLLTVISPASLYEKTFLSGSVSGFIALYWISRIMVQFFYFDRNSFPKGKIYVLGEISLLILFVFLALVYGLAFYTNFK